MKDGESTGGTIAQAAAPGEAAAARRVAATELLARHGSSLRKTARRYSLCAEDADDAFQRALEIVLTKAPDCNAEELLRWTHTVTKHEALAVRANRERLLGATPRRPGGEREGEDWLALIPAGGDGPDERLEERERIARSREALRSLKPAELRALTLLAEGYSYAEIGEITGFSRTKINRCLAEGRERFRRCFAHSEDGTRCKEMHGRLSAFCDRELSDPETEAVREHLRACAGCRATMRTYRATAGAASALVPVVPFWRSLLERGQEAIGAIQARLHGVGGGTESAVAQVASAGGTRGAGMAALAKLATVCAGTAGAATACVAVGVAPVPLDALGDRTKAPTVERVSRSALTETPPPAVEYTPAPSAEAEREPEPERERESEAPAAPAPDPADAGAVEFVPPAAAPVASSPPTEEAGSGDAAGEFGP